MTSKWTLPKWSCSYILCKYWLLQATPALTVLIFNPVKVCGIARLNSKITAVCPYSTFNVIHVIIITTIISLRSINRLAFRMETRVHSAVDGDSIHNAEEVLMRAKMHRWSNPAFSSYINTYIYIHVYATLTRKTKMAKSGDLLRKWSY